MCNFCVVRYVNATFNIFFVMCSVLRKLTSFPSSQTVSCVLARCTKISALIDLGLGRVHQLSRSTFTIQFATVDVYIP